MKLLVLSHISELVGGAEKSLIDLLEIWEEKYKIEPIFILRTPVGTLAPELKKRNWKYIDIDYTFWSESNPPKTQDLIQKKNDKNTKAIIEIEKIILQQKPDLVFTNSVVCPWAAIAANNQGVPHAWFVREYGDLDHGRKFDIGRERTWKDVERLSNLIITNSLALAKHLEKYIETKKLTTLYHPFNLSDIESKSKEKVKDPFVSKDSLKLILTAGSLTSSKGVKEAVIATGKLNKDGYQTELCLVGRQDNKPYLSEIHEIINKYKIKSKIHFVGWQKNPLSYVAKADVGIMASRMEAFGRVTFEYMVIGKPVLGTKSGGTPELVVNNQNGFLYKWGDVDSLVKGLREYANNNELVKKHSANSRKFAKKLMETQYNPDELFKRLQSISGEANPYNPDIFYREKLPNYEKLKKQNSMLARYKNKLKNKSYSKYRRTRTFARKVIKGH